MRQRCPGQGACKIGGMMRDRRRRSRGRKGSNCHLNNMKCRTTCSLRRRGRCRMREVLPFQFDVIGGKHGLSTIIT